MTGLLFGVVSLTKVQVIFTAGTSRPPSSPGSIQVGDIPVRPIFLTRSELAAKRSWFFPIDVSQKVVPVFGSVLLVETSSRDHRSSRKENHRVV